MRIEDFSDYRAKYDQLKQVERLAAKAMANTSWKINAETDYRQMLEVIDMTIVNIKEELADFEARHPEKEPF